MKKTSPLFLVALCLWAGSIPNVHAATWQSTDATLIQNAKAQALIEGKKVLVHVSAAWCGPCAVIDDFLVKEAAALKPALDKYVVVKIEELQLEMYLLTDFLSVDNFDYPNFYLIDPLTGKEDNMAVIDEVPAWYVQVLNQFAAGVDLATEYQNQYRALYKAGEQFGYDAPGTNHWDILDQAMISGAMTQSDQDYAKFIAEVRLDAKTSPNQFIFNGYANLNMWMHRYYDFAAGRAGFSPLVAQSIDKDAFADFSKGVGPFYGETYVFQTKLGKIYREQGLLAASNSCDSLRKAADLLYSGGDPYDLGCKTPTGREIFCAHLAYLAGTATQADTLARFMAIPQSERDVAEMHSMALYASLGDFQAAIAEVDKALNQYRKWYGTGYPKMLGRVEEALMSRRRAYEASKTHP